MSSSSPNSKWYLYSISKSFSFIYICSRFFRSLCKLFHFCNIRDIEKNRAHPHRRIFTFRLINCHIEIYSKSFSLNAHRRIAAYRLIHEITEKNLGRPPRHNVIHFSSFFRFALLSKFLFILICFNWIIKVFCKMSMLPSFPFDFYIYLPKNAVFPFCGRRRAKN